MITLKVFDLQKMPEEVQKSLLHYLDSEGPPNGSYQEIQPKYMMQDLNDPKVSEADKSHIQKLYNWLLANGMNKDDDMVLINYWW